MMNPLDSDVIVEVHIFDVKVLVVFRDVSHVPASIRYHNDGATLICPWAASSTITEIPVRATDAPVLIIDHQQLRYWRAVTDPLVVAAYVRLHAAGELRANAVIKN